MFVENWMLNNEKQKHVMIPITAYIINILIAVLSRISLRIVFQLAITPFGRNRTAKNMNKAIISGTMWSISDVPAVIYVLKLYEYIAHMTNQPPNSQPALRCKMTTRESSINSTRN